MLSAGRIVTLVFSTIFFTSVVFAAYFQEIYLLFIPFFLLICYYLLQHPQILFCILIACVPWSVEYSINNSLGTDLPDEPLMLLAAGAAIIGMIYRRKKKAERNIFHPLTVILLLQLLWVLITIIFSSNTLVSVKYILAKSWYLLAFVSLPLIFFKDEKKLKKLLFILLVSMLAITAVSFFRQAVYHFAFNKVNTSLQPFFRNHVNYSSLLVFMVPVIIAFIQLTDSRKRRILFRLGLFFILTALYFSYSRGAWLALLVGLMAYIFIRKKLLPSAFLFFIMTALLAGFWIGSGDRYLVFSNDYKSTIYHASFSDHMVATYEMKDVSTAERFYRWVAGVRMIKESWATGFGPTTFYDHYKSYTLPAFKTWVSSNKEHSTVHNYFLLLIIEQGIIGLLLFLLLLGSMFGYIQIIYNRTKEIFWKIMMACLGSLLAMVCAIIFLSDMIETDKVGSVFYLTVSIIIIADSKTGKKGSNLSTDIHGIS